MTSWEQIIEEQKDRKPTPGTFRLQGHSSSVTSLVSSTGTIVSGKCMAVYQSCKSMQFLHARFTGCLTMLTNLQTT